MTTAADLSSEGVRHPATAQASLQPADLHDTYRPDIDGLRAIAVLSVVGYHAFPARLTGGFVGVDIFFVISGFLISSIIAKAAANDRFSYLDFYARRVKRIFPALLLVLLAVSVYGWFRLFSNELRQLGKHFIAAASFTSNFVLRDESGYFDSASEAKPLLHLWSLAIEEQFYVVWPLLLATLVRRTRATTTLVIIGVITLVSFGLNLALVADERTTAFYSPLTRIWELMLGALLAHVLARHTMAIVLRAPASWCGLALIVWAVVRFDPTIPYPSWFALAPTVGTMLVIGAGAAATPNRRLLGSNVAVWFGSISYPLYLWHWPILSVAYIENGTRTPGTTLVVLVLFAVALAWMTDRWFERPVRASADLRRIPAFLCAAMAASAAVGGWALKYDGFVARMPDRNAYVEFFNRSFLRPGSATSNDPTGTIGDGCNFYDVRRWLEGRATTVARPAIDPACTTRPDNASKVVFLWGDSHAEHLRNGLRRALPDDVALLQVSTSGCDPDLASIRSAAGAYCDASNAAAMDAVRRTRPDVVIVAQRDGHTAARLRRTASALTEAGAGVVIALGPIPQWELELHKIIARHYWTTTPDHLARFLDQRVQRQDRELKASLTVGSEPFIFVDLFDALCTTNGCTTFIDGDRRDGLLTYDYGHLTPRASVWFAEHVLMPVVTPALAMGSSSTRLQTRQVDTDAK